MVLKFFLLFFLISAQLTHADEKNISDFVQLAQKTAHLEADLSRLKFGWSSMLPNFLSPEYKKKVDFDFEPIKSPAKYYGQSAVYRKNLKIENKKLVFLEGFLSKKEYQQRTQEIATLQKTLNVQRAGLSPDVIKRLISGVHEGKLKIFLPALDDILGIEYESTESQISKEEYKLLDACINTLKENSQTKYDEIRLLFQYLKLSSNDVFYDLGSGYGRVIFYGGVLNPTTSFKGVEIIKERVMHAQPLAEQLGLKNVKFIANDILVELLDDGTVFYIYNAFPSIMGQAMEKLKLVAKKHTIKIIYEGPREPHIENADWLELEKDLIPQRTAFPLKVYRSKL